MAGASRPEGSRPDDEHHDEHHDDHPLDELFVVGAQYHEPSAAERAQAARDAEHRAKEESKRREKRVKHTRRALEGGGPSYDRRTAVIGLAVIVALAVVFAVTGVMG